MENVINQVSKELIKSELTPEKFLRTTNFANNQLYTINHFDSPNIMNEIGRLREISFRVSGGGTGKSVDIDYYDTAKIPYQQLIVWDPDNEEILGGYRYIKCNDTIDEAGEFHLATSKLFTFSPKFKEQYLPYSLELGRSFVSKEYMTKKAGKKGLFALDNLWDGLGALSLRMPEIKYFLGKVTMYLSYDKLARDYILFFLEKHFGDKEDLIVPKLQLSYHTPIYELAKVFTGKTFKEDHKILSKKVRALNENIPPLINSYMNLSSTMKVFGTTLNDTFGDVEETGILVTLSDIYPEKKERHIMSFFRRKI